MEIDQFLHMRRDASVAERIFAASALARACLQLDVSAETRNSAEAALTLMLDDCSPKVRAAIAEVFSTSPYAPLHLVSALAGDQPEVSGFILTRSLLLSDAELIDRVALGGEVVQCLIAMRPKLSFAVSAAIAEVGQATACVDLVANRGAQIAAITFRRLSERWGQNAQMRLALLDHPGLPAECRHLLAVKLGEVLSNMQLVRSLMGERRASAVTREACLKASLHIAEHCNRKELPALVEHLRLRGDLTTGFLLRTVAGGKIDFFAAMLVALSGMAEARVLNLLADGRDAALGALMRQAGLAESTHAVVTTAIKAWRKVANGRLDAGPQQVSKLMLDTVQSAVPGGHAAANDDLAALLRSIHFDLIRENIRTQALLVQGLATKAA